MRYVLHMFQNRINENRGADGISTPSARGRAQLRERARMKLTRDPLSVNLAGTKCFVFSVQELLFVSAEAGHLISKIGQPIS